MVVVIEGILESWTDWRLYRLAPEASAGFSEAISTVRSSVFLASAWRPAMDADLECQEGHELRQGHDPVNRPSSSE